MRNPIELGEKVTRLLVRASSRLSGFHRQSPAARRERLVESRWLTPDAARALERMGGFDETCADAMIENVIGLHGLPLGLALNFQVDGRERVIPMAVEEPSIVAAASYAARLVSEGGGFHTEADPPLVAAQIELREVPDVPAAVAALAQAEPELLARANALIPAMVARGGGARELEVRILEAGELCVHVLVDCRDAMGANTVNAVAEGLADRLAELSGGHYGLRILSNLTDRRKVHDPRAGCLPPRSRARRSPTAPRCASGSSPRSGSPSSTPTARSPTTRA